MKKIEKVTILNIVIIVSSIMLLNSCQKDENEGKFTIKGKLLNSCDKPEPVNGHQIFLEFSYGINNKYEQIAATTLADGSFELKYEKKNAMGEMTISGRQTNGSGTLNYLFGIPIGRDLDIGNLYLSNNFTAFVRINTKRNTSMSDTLYYKRGKNFVFETSLIGPFNQNQIIDTLVFRNTQFYDIDNISAYRGDGSFPSFNYPYKIGLNSKESFASNNLFQPCSNQNFYNLIIE
jgi:hypothetical protein